MNHYASPAFWSLYNKLPAEIRGLADKTTSYSKPIRDTRRCISNASDHYGPCESAVTIARSATTLTMAFSGSASGRMRTTTSLSANKLYGVPRQGGRRWLWMFSVARERLRDAIGSGKVEAKTASLYAALWGER